MKKFTSLVLAAFVFVPLFALQGASLPSGFTEMQVGGNVGSSPTAMEISPDGRIFVCLQGGQLRVIKNDMLLATPFIMLSVNSVGERGLLGVAFDPDFANNQFVYLYYTTSTSPIHNRVSRFTANGDVVLAGSEVVLLELENLSASNHNGGAIHFGPDGKLYVAVGENAVPSNAQSIANRLGKILRINSDGSIPLDNPSSFPGITGSTTGVNRAIWSVGLRNPFTFTFQAGTGRMFINDVGQSTWEEINEGIAGSNYGWAVCEGICSPPNANYRNPLFQYPHSGGGTGSTGCAIVGAAFYNPATNQFPNSYSGKYFFADLCNGWIRTFDPAIGTASAFASGIATPVDLKVGDDGYLYYLAQGNGGQVFRVQFTSTVAVQSAVSRKTHGGAGDFDIPLPLAGPAGIEPRDGGTTGDHQIVVTLSGNGPISVDGNPQAQVTAGSALIGSGGVSNGGAVTVNGSAVIIPLTNVTNAQTLSVTLNNVNDGTTTRSFTIPMSVLVADINASGNVSASDVAQVKAASGQSADATNFRADIDAGGAINATDIAIAKNQSGMQLPPQPPARSGAKKP